MGYRGKLDDQHRARELRAQAWALVEIADELGVAKSTVSLWVRDVEFEPRPRRTARKRAPNALQRRKQAEIDEMVAFFCAWLRRFFNVDEARLRVRLYLHQGLDLAAANRFWSELTGIPVEQFQKPYRSVPDPSIRTAKHVHGCAHIIYSCSRTHREVMGLIRALLSSQPALPG